VRSASVFGSRGRIRIVAYFVFFHAPAIRDIGAHRGLPSPNCVRKRLRIGSNPSMTM
jgi:hypothetical protein